MKAKNQVGLTQNQVLHELYNMHIYEHAAVLAAAETHSKSIHKCVWGANSILVSGLAHSRSCKVL